MAGSDLSLPDDRAEFAAARSLMIALGDIRAASAAGHDYRCLTRLGPSGLAAIGRARSDLAALVLARHMS